MRYPSHGELSKVCLILSSVGRKFLKLLPTHLSRLVHDITNASIFTRVARSQHKALHRSVEEALCETNRRANRYSAIQKPSQLDLRSNSFADR